MTTSERRIAMKAYHEIREQMYPEQAREVRRAARQAAVQRWAVRLSAAALVVAGVWAYAGGWAI